MKREVSFSRVLRAINNYFMFFLLVAFVITSCTMLFVTVLSRDLGIELNGENLNTAAKLTFWNVIFISLIFTLVDALRRRLTVDIPVKRITAAADKMMQGDFSVRIPTVSRAVADDKFNEIINCINKMAEELSGVETLRTDFIANVSHEMKTPLSVMKNYAVMLSAPKIEDAERIEYARAVADASDRLSNMMTNILKLNRLENQKIFPKVEKYDLGEQLCECFLQYESVWERRNIEIECNIEEGVFVSCDAELLSLVWNNLISNAFKFTNDGGVSRFLLRVMRNTRSLR